MTMEGIFEQTSYPFRFDWGLDGLCRLAPESDVVVIVDVLSFTTAVSVATERGGTVYPYRWADHTAEAYAATVGAILLGKRTDKGLSLSPSSLQHARAGQKMVLPSPNGSTLASVAVEYGKTVVAGSLRNASAVADFIADSTKSVTVVAAGERWPNDNLRPAVEDLVGAGAILSHLDAERLSPEAKSAVAVFESVKKTLRATLMDCASGRELRARGFADDVEIASRLNESSVVPVMFDGAFRA